VTLFRGVIASLLLTAAPAFAARSTASTSHVQDSAHLPPKPGSANARDATPRRTSALHRRSRAYARVVSRNRDDDQDNCSDASGIVSADGDPPEGAEVIARGTASWYDTRGNGIHTSSGERFDENAMTAAHSWLPLGTRIRVTVVGTNSSVIVTINDRIGTRRRVIDLSKGAARELGILGRGIATVTLTRS